MQREIIRNEGSISFACDNKLFIKSIQSGREFIRNVMEAPSYEGQSQVFFNRG